MAVINLDYKPGGALNPLDANGHPMVRRVDINAHLIVRETGPDGTLVFGGTLQGRLGQPVSQGDDWIFSAPAEAFVEFGYGNNTLTFGHGSSPSPTWASLNHVPSMGFFGTTFGTDTIKVPWGVHLDLMAGGIGRFDRLEFDAASPTGQLTVATLRVEELVDQSQAPATLGSMPQVFGSPGIDRLELDGYAYYPGAVPTLQLNLKPLVLTGFDGGLGTRLPYFGLDAPGSNGVPANLPDHLALVNFQGQVEAHLTVPIHVVTLGAATVSGSLRGDLIDASGGGPLNAGGLAGDDTFVPSPQADAINGGTDFDTVIYRDATVIVDLALGATQGQPPGAAAGDTLVSIEAVWGSDLPGSPGSGGNYRGDSLWGDAHDNLLDGRAGNDTLGGFSGNDTLVGGAGYDVAHFAGERLLYAVQPGVALGSSGPTSDLVLVGTGPMAGQGQDAVAGVELFEFLDEPGYFHTLAQLQGRQGLFTDSTVVLDYGVGGALNPVDGNGAPRVDALSLNIRDDNVYEMDRFGQIVGGGEIDDILARPNLGAAERYGLVLPPNGTVLLGPGADMVVAQGSINALLGSSPVFVDGLGGEDAIGGMAGRTTAYVAGNLQNFEVVRFDPAASAATATTIAFDLSDGAVPTWRVDGSPGKDILRFNLAPASSGGQVIDLALRNLSWPGAQQGSRAGDIDLVHVVATTMADPLFLNVPDGLPVLVQSGSGTDVLQGAGGGDLFAGGGGSDSLYGEQGDDVLLGEAGDDLLRGGEGDDLIDGGPGVDMAAFNGPRSAFEVLPPTLQWGGVMPDLVLRDTRAIFAPDGTDGLVSIERFRFFDGTYTLAEMLPTFVALSSANVPSVSEGSSFATAGVLTFQVTRSGDLSGSTSVTLRVEGGDSPAADSGDLALVRTAAGSLGAGFGDRTVTFGPGQSALTVEVVAQTDLFVEPIESVRLTLLSVTGGQLDPSGVMSAQGLILNDDVPPPAVAITAVNDPVPEGGIAQFRISRSGDRGPDITVAWKALGLGADPASAADLDGGITSGLVQLPSGVDHVMLNVPILQDRLPEADEGLRLSLQQSTGATLGFPDSTDIIIVDDDPRLLAPALAVSTPALIEGDVQTLSITPAPWADDPAALQYEIDWGDGSPTQAVSGTQLAAAAGVFTHPYADDPDGPVNLAALQLSVTVRDAASAQQAQATRALTIEDSLPSVSYTWGNSLVEHGQPFWLTVTGHVDVAGDPLQQFHVQWDGDVAGQQTLALGGTASRSFGGLGQHSVRLDVVNDDGPFTVATLPFATTATAGAAAPNGTPTQWAAAWTDSLMSFSHKANADNPSESWSPVTRSPVNSGVLAGGDVFGGLLGVSGQSARTSSVRQEIDGTEALRIQLTGGEHADSLIIDLARLFTDDAPGLREAGLVLLYDGSTLVGGTALRAENANGRLHVELFNQPLFDSVIFRAGTLDENAGGLFRPGGLVNSQGGHVPATATVGSDYLIESVQFLDLPDIAFTGVPIDAGG
jgi:hypothetical protein